MEFLANKSKIISGRENTIGANWQTKYHFYMNAVIAKEKRKGKNLYITRAVYYRKHFQTES